MDHSGHLQAGGVESGQPWSVAVASVTDKEISFTVKGKRVARFRRDQIMLSPEGEMYRVVAPNETLFFKPDNLERFVLGLKTDRNAAEEIALAATTPPPPTTAGGQHGAPNKAVAGVLGILLGSFGAHKFYLGQTSAGILYALFFWSGIPGLIGFIEGIVYLFMSDAEFARRYG